MSHTNYNLRLLICSLIIVAIPLHGATKLHVAEGRPIVDGVYVNGHGPFRFLLDTGANVNLVETGLARKIGMNATFQTELSSSDGKTAASGSDGNEVTLDTVKATAQKFLFTDLEAVHKIDPDVRGVLGQWFLAGFDYRLDLRNKHLNFGKQDAAGTRAQFANLNGRPVVATNLGNLVLDSGTARLILFGAQADSEGNGYVKTLTGLQNIGTASRKLTIEGSDVWHGDAVTMPSRTEPGIAGLLPLSFFRAIYVCNSEGYAVFE
jgi:hypothetical protein